MPKGVYKRTPAILKKAARTKAANLAARTKVAKRTAKPKSAKKARRRA